MRVRFVAPFFLLSLLLVACGGDEGGKKKAPSDPDVKVAEEVVVLEEDTLESLISFDLDLGSGSGALRFQAGDPALEGLEAGAVIVAGPTQAAPYGFLQRIEAIGREGEEITVATRQATLEEIFEEAEIDVQVELRPEDLTETETQHEGITIQGLSTDQLSQGLSYDFLVDFDKVLVDLDGDHETKDDQLRIDGSFKFSAGLDAKIKIGTKYLVIPTLEHLKFVAYMSEEADLTLTGALSMEFEKEIEVANLFFGTIVVPVGPVPVVFSIDLQITVGAQGKLEAHLVATASQSLDLSVGAEYRRDDGWKNLSDFDSSFDFPLPEISARGSARAFAKPMLGVKIYGIAGPYAYSTVFAETDAEYDRDPFWNFVAGVDLGVGFKAELPVIGELANWSRDFELFRKTMGSSENQAPTLEIVTPTDGARIEEGEALEVRVRANDREDRTVEVKLLEQGRELAKGSASRGNVLVLQAGNFCPGSYQLDVVAKDSKGAETREKIDVVVVNRVPTVTVRTDLLEDLVLFPGSYLTAFASARDASCDGAPTDQGLIEWYLDEEWVGAGERLIHQLPASLAPGRELVLEARYDDGTDVGSSEEVELTISSKPAGLDLPPNVFILSPVQSGAYLMAVTYSLDGFAVDLEDGPLGSSDLLWEFSEPTGTGWIALPRGATSFSLSDIYGAALRPGVSVSVRLTATDSGGNATQSVVTIEGTVAG